MMRNLYDTDQSTRKTDLQEICDVIKHLLKRKFDVPPTAASECLYGNRTDVPPGVPLAAENSDIAHIDGYFKLQTF